MTALGKERHEWQQCNGSHDNNNKRTNAEMRVTGRLLIT